MEHANLPVRFEIGGRTLALRFNGRAERLFNEKRASINGDYFGGLVLFAHTIWACCHNAEQQKDIPDLDWLEDQLDLRDMPRLEALMKELRPPEMEEKKAEAATLSPGGPSPSTTSESGPPTSGT